MHGGGFVFRQDRHESSDAALRKTLGCKAAQKVFAPMRNLGGGRKAQENVISSGASVQIGDEVPVRRAQQLQSDISRMCKPDRGKRNTPSVRKDKASEAQQLAFGKKTYWAV